MEANNVFQPSLYQQAIFDFLKTQAGHLQISAVAGSGKTTTIIEAMKRLPIDERESTLMCAFSRQIADTLLTRVPEEVTVRTIHAIGRGALAYHFGGGGVQWNAKVVENKYRKLVGLYWTQYHRREYDPEREVEAIAYQLLHFARVTLSSLEPDDLEKLALSYELTLPDSKKECDALFAAIPVILQWGSEGVEYEDDKTSQSRPSYGPHEMIDFDDMLWLPWKLGINPRRYKNVMVDEVQDLSAAQLSLVMKSLTPKGRLVAVGDPRQAIYAFTGAGAQAFWEVQAMMQSTLLPLSVCYRCPQAVVRLAQQIVPEIEAADNAEEGTVEHITEETFSGMVTQRDMVLCRTNAPLIAWAFRLIGDGKPAKVRGRDIGTMLTKTIEQIARRVGNRFTQFHDSIGEWEDEQVRLAISKGSESAAQSVHDRADCCRAVYEGAVCEGAKSIDDLRDWVARIFADDDGGHILLSSIHKAKGLESDRVFLLRPDLLPHPAAKSESAREQERNLRYVAVTRAMRELFIVRPEKED